MREQITISTQYRILKGQMPMHQIFIVIKCDHHMSGSLTPTVVAQAKFDAIIQVPQLAFHESKLQIHHTISLIK
jgi:hypothetical protein